MQRSRCLSPAPAISVSPSECWCILKDWCSTASPSKLDRGIGLSLYPDLFCFRSKLTCRSTGPEDKPSPSQPRSRDRLIAGSGQSTLEDIVIRFTHAFKSHLYISPRVTDVIAADIWPLTSVLFKIKFVTLVPQLWVSSYHDYFFNVHVNEENNHNDFFLICIIIRKVIMEVTYKVFIERVVPSTISHVT